MRPSRYTSWPFFRYFWAVSAVLPQTTILCHSVRFCRSPLLSLKDSSVASEKLQTAWPPLVYRVSGSRPKRPTKITLLTDIFFLQLTEKDNTAKSGAQIVVGKLLKWEGCCSGRVALSVVSVNSALKAFPEKA